LGMRKQTKTSLPYHCIAEKLKDQPARIDSDPVTPDRF
jgi:hypothetical protein